MKNKLLTILVPAFNSYDGVTRIINNFKHRNDVEIIVSDDSNNTKVSQDIELFISKLNQPEVMYLKHNSTSNAVDNWNFLLNKAKGKFFLLVHHDEHFNNDFFIDYLNKNQDSIELLVLPITINHPHNITRRVASWMQNISIKLFSSNVLTFNYLLGPTACLVVRNNDLTLFNRDLVYYVDVEWFHRIFSKLEYKNIRFFSHSRVVSTITEESITNSIKHKIENVIKDDLSVLNNIYPNNIFIIRLLKSFLYKSLYKLLILTSFVPYYVRIFKSYMKRNTFK